MIQAISVVRATTDVRRISVVYGALEGGGNTTPLHVHVSAKCESVNGHFGTWSEPVVHIDGGLPLHGRDWPVIREAIERAFKEYRQRFVEEPTP